MHALLQSGGGRASKIHDLDHTETESCAGDLPVLVTSMPMLLTTSQQIPIVQHVAALEVIKPS